jgi:hypothetical protein
VGGRQEQRQAGQLAHAPLPFASPR